AGTKPAFTDVPNSDPDFKYIEGMNDAGWSIGFKDGTFRPDAQLTREQMISIKTPLDKPFKPTGDLGFTMKWTDYEKISKDFYEVMCWESYSYGNWKRLYGTTKTCLPQKPVTRAEAAVCVWQVGDNSASDPKGTAAD